MRLLSNRLLLLLLAFTLAGSVAAPRQADAALSVSAAALAPSCEQVFSPALLSDTAPASRFNLFTYYFDKIGELKELDSSAPLAMTLRLLIMNTTVHTEHKLIALKYLREIHGITRGAALEKLEERRRSLIQVPAQPDLSIDTLNLYIPSKNAIRVVNFGDDQFVVFDGNGRLVALKQVFDESTRVEVELFYSESRLLQANLRKLLQVRANLKKAN